ncbi:MAG: hypothetical protein JWL77_7011 [Chthonomonadaceae bacterium]|nr:hypothetical protein [Chthonomonadaceae bacterium]
MKVKGHGPRTVVLLCRGCCCGTRAKHPNVDHDEQEQLLEQAAADGADVELRVVDCLDECNRSNVAVVRRLDAPLKERDTWLGGLLTRRATAALGDWVRDGADGPLPDAVAGLRFRHQPPRRSRPRGRS